MRNFRVKKIVSSGPHKYLLEAYLPGHIETVNRGPRLHERPVEEVAVVRHKDVRLDVLRGGKLFKIRSAKNNYSIVSLFFGVSRMH